MRRLALVLTAAAAVAIPASANAGPYGSALEACLLRSTTAQDRSDLVLWIYSAMSAHPAAQSYSSMSPAKRDQVAKTAAGLMQRLIVQDCRKEAVAVFKHEGADSFQNAFAKLGEKAMLDMIADPKVEAELSRLGAYMDTKEFEKLGEEAVR